MLKQSLIKLEVVMLNLSNLLILKTSYILTWIRSVNCLGPLVTMNYPLSVLMVLSDSWSLMGFPFLNSWCKKYVKFHLIVCLCFFADTPVSSKYTVLDWELCYVHLGKNPQYQHLVLLCLWSDLNYICIYIYIYICSGRIWIINLNFFGEKIYCRGGFRLNRPYK